MDDFDCFSIDDYEDYDSEIFCVEDNSVSVINVPELKHVEESKPVVPVCIQQLSTEEDKEEVEEDVKPLPHFHLPENQNVSDTDGEQLKFEHLENYLNSVRKQSFLYDRQEANFKNKELKQKVWSDIGNQWGIDATTAKILWRSLRNRYLQERWKSKLSESGTTSSYKPVWDLYDTMDDILRPCLERCAAYHATTAKVKKESYANVSSVTNEVCLPTTINCKSELPRGSHLVGKRKISEISDVVNAVEELVQTSHSLLQQNYKKEESGDMVKRFCDYLEVRLRNLDSIDRRDMIHQIELLMQEKEKSDKYLQ